MICFKCCRTEPHLTETIKWRQLHLAAQKAAAGAEKVSWESARKFETWAEHLLTHTDVSWLFKSSIMTYQWYHSIWFSLVCFTGFVSIHGTLPASWAAAQSGTWQHGTRTTCWGSLPGAPTTSSSSVTTYSQLLVCSQAFSLSVM